MVGCIGETALSYDQIVRHMMLRDLGVIVGVLLRERKPCRFCILDRCQLIMSGDVPAMRGRSLTVAHICHSVMVGGGYLALELE